MTRTEFRSDVRNDTALRDDNGSQELVQPITKTFESVTRVKRVHMHPNIRTLRRS